MTRFLIFRNIDTEEEKAALLNRQTTFSKSLMVSIFAGLQGLLYLKGNKMLTDCQGKSEVAMENPIEALEQWKARLERKRAVLTREIDDKIRQINELIGFAKAEQKESLSLLSDSSTVELKVGRDLLVWEAIQLVMKANPEKWWRGSDLAKELVRLGYRSQSEYVPLGQNVSNTLKWYGEDKHRRPALLGTKKERGIPLYRLKNKEAA